MRSKTISVVFRKGTAHDNCHLPVVVVVVFVIAGW